MTVYDTAMDATWPAARIETVGPWLLREGRGGGKRVSAASATRPVAEADIPQAEAGLRAMGQVPLFRIGQGEGALDALLAARGYSLIDPVVIYSAPVAVLGAERPRPVSAMTVWEPLQVVRDVWAESGLAPERIEVMYRAGVPKTSILGRTQDRPAGAAFVAAAGPVVMLHALEVLPRFRRQQVAVNILREAAHWAADQGAEELALAVTAENAPARALYEGLGMKAVDAYHYRLLGGNT